jgi:hypothetical protein
VRAVEIAEFTRLPATLRSIRLSSVCTHNAAAIAANFVTLKVYGGAGGF